MRLKQSFRSILIVLWSKLWISFHLRSIKRIAAVVGSLPIVFKLDIVNIHLFKQVPYRIMRFFPITHSLAILDGGR